jgi:hypothetical protein
MLKNITSLKIVIAFFHSARKFSEPHPIFRSKINHHDLNVGPHTRCVKPPRSYTFPSL